MSSQTDQPSLILTQRLADGTVEWIRLTGPERVPAVAGGAYALIDRADYEAPQTLVARRQGDDLVLEVQAAEVLVLEGFFVTAEASFHPEPDVAGGAGPFSGAPLTPESPMLAESTAGEQVVWTAEPAEVGEPEIAARDESGDADGSEDGGVSPLMWGGLALGGLGLAAAAGGGGGGGGSDGGGGTPTPDPTQNTVEGSVAGGPVIEGNGLSVEVFEADGISQLGEAKVDAEGRFSVDVGDYTGVVILRVVDADSGEDYLDEASNAPKDLNADFSAVQQIGGSSGANTTVAVNINPVTTLAAMLAEREADGGALTLAQVNDSNAAIADLFGLDDLHDVSVVTINGGAFDPGGGPSPGETYGAILAAFSGVTFSNGGDSQQTIDSVLAGLTVSTSGTAELDESTQSMLLRGAQTTEIETEVSLSDVIVRVLDGTPPEITSGGTAAVIDENSGSGQVVYTAVADDTTAVTYSLADSGDADDFDIDPDTGAVALLEDPDFETQSSYSFTVVATDAAGNSSQQTVSLDINNLDESAPTITSGAIAEPIDENSGSGQVIYTASATDEGPVTFSLIDSGDAEDFDIDADTGEVTLLEDPDFETQQGYTFTVVATDDEGNSSQQAVTLDINNLDEVAPTITSSATANSLDENTGSGQSVYTATADDSADISDDVTFSLAPGGDADDFDIDPNTGEVTLLENPDFETQSSYSFTVVATDAAGNSSQLAVSLEINDIDDTPPSVTAVALTDADGAQNNTLNAGDTVTVTVTMSESTTVDTSGGMPQIALAIGASTVFADYVSGSGSTSLDFEYIVQAGDNDANGISVPANALESGGGSLTDAAGNTANLSHAAVFDNGSFVVDTRAPTLSASTPADDADDVPVNADIVLTFSEDIQAGDGNIIVSDGSDTRIIDVTDESRVSISGNTVTIDPVFNLDEDSGYSVQIDAGALLDEAGNAYAGISDTNTLNFETDDEGPGGGPRPGFGRRRFDDDDDDEDDDDDDDEDDDDDDDDDDAEIDSSVGVFDSVKSVSVDDSDRTFDSDVDYEINIRVDSGGALLNSDAESPGTWNTWSGAGNLGSDDRMTLAADGADAQSFATVQGDSSWSKSALGTAAFLHTNAGVSITNAANITNQSFLTIMPVNIMTSQGLA